GGGRDADGSVRRAGQGPGQGRADSRAAEAGQQRGGLVVVRVVGAVQRDPQAAVRENGVAEDADAAAAIHLDAIFAVEGDDVRRAGRSAAHGVVGVVVIAET